MLVKFLQLQVWMFVLYYNNLHNLNMHQYFSPLLVPYFIRDPLFELICWWVEKLSNTHHGWQDQVKQILVDKRKRNNFVLTTRIVLSRGYEIVELWYVVWYAGVSSLWYENMLVPLTFYKNSYLKIIFF